MHFLLDENVDVGLIAYLQQQGHDATAVAQDHPAALSDTEVLGIALVERRVLITNDKDFGDLIFQHRLPHAGVMLFRLQNERLEHQIDRMAVALENFASRERDFIVVTDSTIRPRT